MMTRRGLLAGLSAVPFAPAAFAADPLFATLDAVGPLEADAFHPGRVRAAMAALIPLGEAGMVSALRQYLAHRSDPPGGLFAVVRGLAEIPPADAPGMPWPGVLQPGHLRPPALGAPHPPEPAPLSAFPRYPLVLLEDVPLSVVMGYALGGLPEPLSMHLDGLDGASWRTEPLRPASVGSIRALLVHWGQWPAGSEVGAALEDQLARLSESVSP